MSELKELIVFKFITVGDSGVGKSCLLQRFIHDEFTQTETTIGIEFGSKIIHIQDNVKLQIWDTAGQEAFRSISRAYYRGAIGALLVFDIGRMDSFQHVQDWYDDVMSYGDKSTKCILVANKIDRESSRQISSRMAQEWAQKNGMMYLETSAKTGVGVADAFTSLAFAIYKDNNLENIKDWSPDVQRDWEAKGIRIGSSIGVRISQSSSNSNQCCY